ncbi:MAG: hypothetical protein AMXMBFR64_16630 [Myxococcales bacterium]
MNRMIFWIAALGLVAACKREAAEPATENVIVRECYKPFFNAASDGNVSELKAVLSRETIRHMEADVFRAGGVMEGWSDFARVYSDMKISQFIKDVEITDDRAVVKDPVGGTFKCIREDGAWKADLSDY